MKLVIATYGTEGDVRPLAALSRALIDAGHQVHLLADRSTLRHADALGVPTSALSGDIKGVDDPQAGIDAVVANDRGVQGMAKALAHIANTHATAWLREIVHAARDADAILVSGLAAFTGLSAAEYLRRPAIGVGFIPFSPTSAFPAPFVPSRFVPRVLNRTSHLLINEVLWRAFKRSTNRARAEAFDMPRRDAAWTTHPMLYGVSPSLVPAAPDWPDTTFVSGQWIAPSKDWLPPDALRAWLDAGEAPLYVGFGSMVGFDRDRLMRCVVEGVGGRRVLLHPGWAGHDATLPANFFVVDDVPHDWLFPRVSAVIHHGGSGTSHSAARAGVPSVVLAFAGDQAFWGDRLANAGVAPRPLNGHRCSARELADGIAFASRSDVRAKSRALGERMQAENGPAIAVAALERLIALHAGTTP
ncbi:glycosyltransferase [Noviluteimonas gilva]|uniref:Glycosyltransferase n=1 Tax=Noviluteimonas gilva TaxID=2682097 RepID=A0A7C9HP92_9GAMM|nr:glycosyltransferase [Lysobacter gilvus]MUV15670.1 glycosyltransferase [Lysobacter gilvus]